LVALAEKIPKDLLPTTLDITCQIQGQSFQVFTLNFLAIRFPALWPRVLAILNENQAEFDFFPLDILRNLIENLPVDFYIDAMKIICQYQEQDNDWRCKHFLLFLAENISEKYSRQAFELIRKIEYPSTRAFTLIGIAKKHPDFHEEVLELILQISDEAARLSALTGIAKNCAELYEEALAVILQASDKSVRASALMSLLDNHPELYGETLLAIHQIPNKVKQVSSLFTLARKYPELYEEALTKINQSLDKTKRSSMTREILELLPSRYEESDFDDTIHSLLDILGEKYPGLYWETMILAFSEIDSEFGEYMYNVRKLLDHLPLNLYSRALSAFYKIHDELHQASTLITLASNFSQESFLETLKLISPIEDERTCAGSTQDERMRAERLISLSKKISKDFFGKILEVAWQMRDGELQADVIIALARQLPELYPEALSAAQKEAISLIRLNKLHDILDGEIPEELSFATLEEFLHTIPDLEHETWKANALWRLVDRLPETLYIKALEIARRIQDESSKASALTALAEQCPGLYPEALEVARRIQDESSKASALTALVEKCPDLYPEALEVARQIQDESSKASALIALAEKCPDLYPEALEVTRWIQDESSKASALIALVEKCPDLYSEALEVTRWIQDERFKFENLLSLAKAYPELYSEVIAMTYILPGQHDYPEDDYFVRAEALIELADNLPIELRIECFKVIDTIPNEFDKALVLSKFSECWFDDWGLLLLIEARKIQENFYRAHALSALLPRLALDEIDLPFWQELLATLTCRTRAEFLEDIPKLAPAIVALGGEEALRGVVEAMRQVCGWWP
jgi:hypothetical protein